MWTVLILRCQPQCLHPRSLIGLTHLWGEGAPQDQSLSEETPHLASKALYNTATYYLSGPIAPSPSPTPIPFSLATLDFLLWLVQSLRLPVYPRLTLFPLSGRPSCPSLPLKSLSTKLKRREVGSGDCSTGKTNHSCKGPGDALLSSVKCNLRNESRHQFCLFVARA